MKTVPLTQSGLLCLAIIGLVACDSSSSTKNRQAAREWSAPGGAATIAYNQDLPFLQFAPSIDILNYPEASQGRELFVADWEAAPGSRPLLDGLGPLAITDACDNCHLPAARASSLREDGSIGVGLLFRLANANGVTDSHFGGQLQTLATSGLAEGSVRWTSNMASNRPEFELTSNSFALDDGINLGPRLSPQLLGMGLLELVPDAQIAEMHDPDDQDGDGISGRIHWRPDTDGQAIGRYGWKAMQATLKAQTAAALQQDMGLTTTVNHTEPCTNLQTVCDEQNNGGSPEVSDQSLDAINAFLSLLAVPDRRIEDQQVFDQGANLFEQIGCDACHRPELTTGTSIDYPILSEQRIYAYTDLLLHDMGPALSDGVKEGDAEPAEWRTPPLWGLGLIESDEQSRFLHDGRAADIESAIRWHGGEAELAAKGFEQLSQSQQAALLTFLRGI